MSIHVYTTPAPAPSDLPVEIVERKGLGHPDSICDAVMECVSQALCAAYLERFGFIAHHNCDKGALLAGQAEPRPGGGRILEPMRLVLGDRATDRVGDRRIDVAGIAIEAARDWFRRNLPRIDPDRQVRYQVELKPGSEQLRGILTPGRGLAGANDTSAAVGYAPLTETERLVLETERMINAPEFKRRFPESGEDVKVMGVREGRRLELTVAVPLVDGFVRSEKDYFDRKEALRVEIEGSVARRLRDLEAVSVALNPLDRRGEGISGMYLTVLGTSAEHGDSGQVGRGNGVNGLICLQRPQGSEAAAGKNPVSHVGKIYSFLTHRLAASFAEERPDLRGVTVWMCSRIGHPIDRPWTVCVQVQPGPGNDGSGDRPWIEARVRRELEDLSAFCADLVRGRYPVC